MTDQEKAALLQFMGMTHAQAKQTDQMIVGQSQFLRPISTDISRQFETVLRTPVQSEAHQQYTPVQPEQVYIAPQIQYDPQPQPQPTPQSQLEFDFSNTSPNEASKILQELKEINLNLVKIAAILTESNVKAKTKNTIKS